MTHEQEVLRGLRAGELLDNELLVEAFQSAEDHAVSDWIAAEDPHVREKAWHRVHALNEVRAELRRIVADGQYAAAAIRKVNPTG